MERVLVTGHTGFIGGALFENLKNEGHDVKGLSRTTDFHFGLDIPDVVNYDTIYHLASTVNEYEWLHGRKTDIHTNCEGTQDLLEAIRKRNPWCKLVYVSTFFVVGDPPELPVNENTICRPKGVYGASKLFAEQLCKIYANTFDLDISIARLTNVYGPGQERASQRTAAFNWMIKQCVEDRVISLYDNGRIKRDYLYIDDAVRGIKNVKNGASGETYFLSTNIGTSFKQMVDMMIEAANGGSIRVVKSPGFHSRVGIGDFWADYSKAFADLYWVPTVDIKEGIQKTVEWYR